MIAAFALDYLDANFYEKFKANPVWIYTVLELVISELEKFGAVIKNSKDCVTNLDTSLAARLASPGIDKMETYRINLLKTVLPKCFEALSVIAGVADASRNVLGR